MYAPLLFIHSWLRWIVLVASVALTLRFFHGWIRRRSWGSTDNGLVWAYEQALGYQALLGFVLLIGASPLLKAAIRSSGQALGQPAVGFFLIRHPLTMVSALLVFELGRYLARKRAAGVRNRTLALTMMMVTALIGSAVPWPALLWGRPLFRWGF